MHRLNRGEAPPCLAQYHHPQHTWDDVSAPHKAEIRQHLERMQGRRCAYCEGPLDALGQHIDHFAQKRPGRAPQLTFAWENLLLSCVQERTCGKSKDRADYALGELLHPAQEDPELPLRFYADGSIDLRVPPQSAKGHRAQTALRVLNLNDVRLRNMRKQAARDFIRSDPSIFQALSEEEPELRAAIVADLQTFIAGQDFCTALKHLVEDYLPSP